MSAPEMPAGGASESGTLRYTPITVPSVWAFERDQRFAGFLTARLADAEVLGCCLAELRVLAGVRDVFEEWLANRELATKLAHRELAIRVDDDLFTGSISALGWSLRSFAHSVWSEHPKWELAFHPNTVAAPIDPLSASAGAKTYNRPSASGSASDRVRPGLCE